MAFGSEENHWTKVSAQPVKPAGAECDRRFNAARIFELGPNAMVPLAPRREDGVVDTFV
jgi:hypothetical protein